MFYLTSFIIDFWVTNFLLIKIHKVNIHQLP